jgi:predicted nicotinamide N-methyase
MPFDNTMDKNKRITNKEVVSDNISHLLRGNTFWDTLYLGSHRFTINRIRETDLLLEVISDAEFNKDEKLPYWSELWPSSIALAEYLLEKQRLICGKTILELGCGLGLAGIAATACGAQVLFTDYDAYALEFTQINFERNFKRTAAVKLMDWRTPVCDDTFDMILAADVLYEKRWLTAVAEVIDRCLKPRGTVLIAEPNRRVAESFFDHIDKKKWLREPLLKRIHVNDKLHTITIHRIVTC